MADPLQKPSSPELDFDIDDIFSSIPPDFNFIFTDDSLTDGILLADDAKSHENSESPEVRDPPLHPASAAQDQGVQDDQCLDTLFPEPEVFEGLSSNESVSPHESSGSSTWVEDLERFLLQDDDEHEGAGAESLSDDGFFLDEIFGDAALEGSGEDQSVKLAVDLAGGDDATVSDPTTPGSCGSRTPDSDAVEEAPVQVENSKNISEDRRSGGEEDDPLEKKRRRQLRNRDAAMKSRERRKQYIQDLEKKSKSLEMECRRLEHLLYCSTAENLALHQRLQRDKSMGSTAARQESAVLFVELLLLGSLPWLVNLMVLLLVPSLLAQNLKPEVTERARNEELNLIQKGIAGARSPGCRRKYSALRTKMKILLVLSVP